MELWHPALSTQSWVPRQMRLTPTLRIRDVVNIPVATGASAITMLLGPFGGTVTPSDFVSVAQIGRYSGDVGVPGVSGEIFVVPRNTSTLPAGTQIRLHRMGVTISCSGSTTNNPSSFIFYGTLRNVFDSLDFATYAACRTFLEGRAEMHTRSGYSLMQSPAHMATHPLDWGAWAELSPAINTAASGTQIADDTLCTMAIVFSATSGSVDTYQITVHTEWDALVADDASGSGLLASAHALHPVLSLEHLEEAAAGLFSVSGAIGLGTKVSSALGGAPAAGARFLPRVLPALADAAPYFLPLV